MGWSDNALMLSVRRKSEEELLLNLLTQNHGMRPCNLTLDPSDVKMLLPGCELEITGVLTGTSGLVDVKINKVSHGVVVDGPEDPML